MHFKLNFKLAAAVVVALMIAGCQKSIPTSEEDDFVKAPNTLPRAVKDPQTHFTGYGYDATEAYASETGVRAQVIDVLRFQAETGRYRPIPRWPHG